MYVIFHLFFHKEVLHVCLQLKSIFRVAFFLKIHFYAAFHWEHLTTGVTWDSSLHQRKSDSDAAVWAGKVCLTTSGTTLAFEEEVLEPEPHAFEMNTI